MEPKLCDGDYVADGLGGIVRCGGTEALLQRVLFRLTAHRGQLPFLPTLGSRLYLLSREKPAQQLSAARQYIAEALADEDISITEVTLTPRETGRIHIAVLLDCQGTETAVALTV